MIKINGGRHIRVKIDSSLSSLVLYFAGRMSRINIDVIE